MVKPVQIEEKSEDNEDEEMLDSSTGPEQPQNSSGTDMATRGRPAEPTSDAATEPYDDASDAISEPTEAELKTLEQTMKRLSAVAAKVDMGQGPVVSDRMKQLAVDLQRLTTKLGVRPLETQKPPRAEDEPPATRNETYREATDEAATGSADGEHDTGSHQRGVEYRREASLRTGRQPPSRYQRRANNQHEAAGEDAGRRPRQRERSYRQHRDHGRRDRNERHRQDSRGRRYREQRPQPRRSAPEPSPSDGDESSSDDSSHDDRWRRFGSGDENDESDRSSSESSTREQSDSSGESQAAGRRRLPRRKRRYERRERREPRRHRERRYREEPARRPRARNIKDLELPSFTPTPRASVSTWVDRIDLALKGAKESGRGEWSDRSLYFILGNKLMESAARWWVNMDRRLHHRDRTWTKLKVALLRRYGPRVDKSAAEARVNARFRLKNEPYADFAAGLREAADRNEVSERVFLAQFYRCLDRTVRQLVKQPPAPTTLEEAVEKAVEIDDPMDYVTGNQQTTQSLHLPPTSGDGSRMVIIPGVGTLALPADGTENLVEGSMTPTRQPDAPAICTNQQGVYNWPAGVYEFPPGQKWNGRFWATPGNAGKKKAEKKKTLSKTKPEASAKTKKPLKRVAPDSSSEDEAKEQPAKRHKTTNVTKTAATKMISAEVRPRGTTRVVEIRRSSYGERERNETPNRPCFHCGQRTHWSMQCPNEPRCFACLKRGHFARDCTDPDAKQRNDEYLKKRAEELKKTAENEARA